MNIKAGDIFIDITDREVVDIGVCTRPHETLADRWWAKWLGANNEELFFNPENQYYVQVSDDLAARLRLLIK